MHIDMFNDISLDASFSFNCRFTKPQTFADCIGNELPLGWEEAYDKHVGAYYINHVSREYYIFIFLIYKLLASTYQHLPDYIKQFSKRFCS